MVRFLFKLLNDSKAYRVSLWKFDFTRRIQEIRKGGFSKLFALAAVLGRLLRLRLRGEIDLVIFPAGGPHLAPLVRDALLLPCATLLSKNVVMHFHAAGLASVWDDQPFLLRVWLKFWGQRVDGAIVLTDFGKVDPQVMGIQRVLRVPNGLKDRNPMGLLPKAPRSGSGGTQFLYVGHLCNDKGIPELLRAFAVHVEKYPQATLALVGECLGEFSEERLQAELDSLGLRTAVALVGVLEGSELDQQFRDADVLVFPTHAPYESFGLVMVEAMMWGLPVIATDWRANSEVMGNPLPGICYEIEKTPSGSLSESLGKFEDSTNLWPTWSAIGRQRFLDCYSQERFLGRIEDMISDVLDRTSEVV